MESNFYLSYHVNFADLVYVNEITFPRPALKFFNQSKIFLNWSAVNVHVRTYMKLAICATAKFYSMKDVYAVLNSLPLFF